jgi:hypothetical protein
MAFYGMPQRQIKQRQMSEEARQDAMRDVCEFVPPTGLSGRIIALMIGIIRPIWAMLFIPLWLKTYWRDVLRGIKNAGR